MDWNDLILIHYTIGRKLSIPNMHSPLVLNKNLKLYTQKIILTVPTKCTCFKYSENKYKFANHYWLSQYKK